MDDPSSRTKRPCEPAKLLGGQLPAAIEHGQIMRRRSRVRT